VRDEAYLRLAARLARRGAGRVAPNPMVGCVLVSPAREVIGVGHHRAFGGAHAEVEALASCARQGKDPRGATAYVTLEPCSHFGKQPPCAGALVEAGVAEVVAAVRDPGAESGGGFAVLERAGVRCRVVAEAQAVRASAAFMKATTRGLPFVTCKWAQTVDGFTATRAGESQWISGERSRRMVHRARGRVDAVLVGSGTVRADDPMLTARGVRVRRTAVRVVIGEIEAGSRLARTARDVPVVVYVGEDSSCGALREAGVEVVAVGERGGRVDLEAALGHLCAERGVQTVLCEAGATLTGALIGAGLADELLVFTAAMVMGDGAARSAVEVGGARTLADARGWTLAQVRRVGEDVMSVYSRVSESD